MGWSFVRGGFLGIGEISRISRTRNHCDRISRRRRPIHHHSIQHEQYGPVLGRTSKAEAFASLKLRSIGWEKLGMRIIGCLLVIGILLSYAPVFHTDDCPEGDHSGHMKMNCGIPFHCPMTVDVLVSEISCLPLSGLLIPAMTQLSKDGLVVAIFRPPKYSSPNFIPRG